MSNEERSPGGVVVSMSASHAKGPGFDPHRLHELSSKKSTNIEGDDMMTFAVIVVSGIVEIQFLILQWWVWILMESGESRNKPLNGK